MSQPSKCPHCSQPVSVPDGFDPSSRVRCPWCQRDFALRDAWAAAGMAPAPQPGAAYPYAPGPLQPGPQQGYYPQQPTAAQPYPPQQQQPYAPQYAPQPPQQPYGAQPPAPFGGPQTQYPGAGQSSSYINPAAPPQYAQPQQPVAYPQQPPAGQPPAGQSSAYYPPQAPAQPQQPPQQPWYPQQQQQAPQPPQYFAQQPQSQWLPPAGQPAPQATAPPASQAPFAQPPSVAPQQPPAEAAPVQAQPFAPSEAPGEDFLGLPSEEVPFGETAEESDAGAYQFDFLGGAGQQAFAPAPDGQPPIVAAETPLAGPGAPMGATATAATEVPVGAPIPGFEPGTPPLDTAVPQSPESIQYAAEGWPAQGSAEGPTQTAPAGWANMAPGVTPIADAGAAPAVTPWGPPAAPMAQPWGAPPPDAAPMAQPWAPGAQPFDAAPAVQPWGPAAQPAAPGAWPPSGQYPQAQPWGAPAVQPMPGGPAYPAAAPEHGSGFETPSHDAAVDEAVDPALLGLGGHAATEGADSAAVPRMIRPRRPRERNALRELIGAAVGGFMGLFLAYYLLNLVGGEQFNMFDIPLPGIKHTYHNNKKKATKPRRVDNEAGSALPNGHLRLYSADFVRVITSYAPPSPVGLG